MVPDILLLHLSHYSRLLLLICKEMYRERTRTRWPVHLGDFCRMLQVNCEDLCFESGVECAISTLRYYNPYQINDSLYFLLFWSFYVLGK